jgi:hypothetical protein
MSTELRKIGIQDIFVATAGQGADTYGTSGAGVVVTRLDAKQVPMQGVGTDIESYIVALYAGGITGTMLGSGILGTQHFGTFSVPTHAIASGAIGTAQMVTTLKPAVILSSLPDAATYGDGDIVVLTTDGQLYRNLGGTAWTAAVPATGITGSISSTQIADNAITSGKVAANAIYGSMIVGGEIAGSHVVANAIDSGQIAAGAITASELGARAIYAQNIVVANWDNLIPNPNSLLGTSAIGYLPEGSNYYAGTHASSGTFCRKFVASAGGEYFIVTPSGTIFGTQWSGDYIPASPGDVFYLSAEIKEEAGGGEVCGAYVRYYNGATSAVGEGTHAFVTGSTYGTTFFTSTAPSNTEFIVAGFVSGNAGTYYLDNMVLRKGVDANLIVDGAITADKISASAIESQHISAGAITATHITASSITANEISLNSVTGKVAEYTSQFLYGGGGTVNTWQDIGLTGTINVVDGDNVLVIYGGWTEHYSGAVMTCSVRCQRNGTSLPSGGYTALRGLDVEDRLGPTFTFMDSPGSGTHVYNIQAYGGGGFYLYDNNLTVVELIR